MRAKKEEYTVPRKFIMKTVLISMVRGSFSEEVTFELSYEGWVKVKQTKHVIKWIPRQENNVGKGSKSEELKAVKE